MFGKNTKKALLAVCLLLFFLKAGFAFAIKPIENPYKLPEVQYPEIPLSNVETPNVFIQKINDGVYPPGDALGLYIRYFYSLSLIIAVLAVFASLVFGGLQYLLAIGKPGLMVVARDRISSGLLGLVILFSAQFIFAAINPNLSVFNVAAPGTEKCECSKPSDQLSDFCKISCQKIPPVVSETPTYIEIPLGRLIERVLKTNEETRQTAIIVKKKAEDLKNLSQELKNLTDECSCKRSEVSMQCGDECFGGACVGEPCANREKIREMADVKIPKAVELLERWKEQTEARQTGLANERSKLELAEILMRDSLIPPVNRETIIGLENKEIRKLNHWQDIDIRESGLGGSSISMPVPLEECSSDPDKTTMPACTICGDTLFCYGNNNRTCETDSKFNSGRLSFSAAEFPNDIALYNGRDFPVPSRGVSVCDDNDFGCNNSACEIAKGPEDPATFYIPVKGNEEMIATVESLSLSIYDPAPPSSSPPPPTIAPPDADSYRQFATLARAFAVPQKISPYNVPPFTINHQTYVNAISPRLRYNHGADCGVYVAAVVRATIDPDYPESYTPGQQSHLERNPNFDCFRISSADQLRPGDILFSVPNGGGEYGHTLIWLEDGAWQASWNMYLPMGPTLAWTPRMSYVCRYKNF